ncbi:hypothetical protein COO20_09885 [Thalassospira marina]|uniref:Uncharacterized protein n=2 Tax=Thalassospira marina TaxID=2048283 RepID=A0A2N3KVA1_9PROT|nr:hypothetical protein COO20_09885 [Thalassospira marina]
MKTKHINWQYIALGAVLMIGGAIFGIGMWFNSIKYCYGSAFCTYFKNLEWESLCAGLFGLAGGLAVIAVSKEQIKAQVDVSAKQIATMNVHKADELCRPLEFTNSTLIQAQHKLRGIQSGLQKAIIIDPRIPIAHPLMGTWLRVLKKGREDFAQEMEHIAKLLEAHGATNLNYQTFQNASAAIGQAKSLKSWPTGFDIERLRTETQKFIQTIEIASENCRKAQASLDKQISETRRRYIEGQ